MYKLAKLYFGKEGGAGEGGEGVVAEPSICGHLTGLLANSDIPPVGLIGSTSDSECKYGWLSTKEQPPCAGDDVFGGRSSTPCPHNQHPRTSVGVTLPPKKNND